MPNWVFSRLTVDGGPAALTLLAERLCGPDDSGEMSPFTFSRVLARPVDADPVRWNLANWGVKHDACRADTDHEPAPTDTKTDAGSGLVRLVYTFVTAWSQPEPLVALLSAQEPACTFTLDYEEEQGWGGRTVFVAGSITGSSAYDEPVSHAELVERSGTCFCDDELRPFPDCAAQQARAAGVKDPRTLEALDTLGERWEGSMRDLIDVAQAI